MELIKQRLSDFYHLEHERWPGVRVEPRPFIQTPTLSPGDLTDGVTVKRYSDSIYWSYEVPVEYNESLSLKSESRITQVHECSSLRHDFVAEGISMLSTDKKLQTVFGFLHDEDDMLSPDFIEEGDHGISYVIELGTMRGGTERQIIKTYEDKLFKYEMPLINRSTNRVIVYTPIIVTPSHVASSCDLPVELINELIFRMHISLAVESVAQACGFEVIVEEEATAKSRVMRSIQDELEKIKEKDHLTDRIVSITSDFVQKAIGEYSATNVINAYKKSRQLAFEELKSPPDQKKKVQEFTKRQLEIKNTRRDVKSIIGMPLIDPHSTKQTQLPVYRAIAYGKSEDCLGKLWDFALSSSINVSGWKEVDRNELLKEAYSTELPDITLFEERRKKQQKTYHRVNISSMLDNEMLRYLNKDGIFSKKPKDFQGNRLRREYQKKSYTWDTNTNDIDTFLSRTDLLDLSVNTMTESNENVLKLANKANDLTENKNFNLYEQREWMGTKLYRALDVISDIAMELSISIKQNTLRDEMILKKLMNHEVYILIKTTKSDSHLFYSVLVPKGEIKEPLSGLPFRKLIDFGTVLITEFCSVRKDKLANYVNAPHRFLGLVSFWADFYTMRSLSRDVFSKNEEAVKMLLFSVLVSLENKVETEETITQTRYMYMEIFKSFYSISKPNPMKILSKFKERPRSRLNLFIMHRTIRNFEFMLTNKPQRVMYDFEDEEDPEDIGHPGDRWKDLLNFITGSPLYSASQAINLVYLGYLKDKNEISQDNGAYKLVEKIIEEEIKVNENDWKGYYGEVYDRPNKKQFSLDCIIHGCSFLEKKFKKTYGDEWKKVITKEILENLSRHLTHEIATLKASSCVNHNKVEENFNKEDTKNTWRVKVIEAVASQISLFGLNPMQNFKAFLEFVEGTSKGVVCDIFKKQQHGGVREIYVLTIQSRILQLFIETISRTICSYFDEETLTHPQNKTITLDRHKLRSNIKGRQTNSIYADFCSSSDKSRWNQNFFMTTLSVPLFRLTESFFHPSIKRVLNLWSTKFIKLPAPVVDLLSRRITLSSDSFKELFRKFHNQIGSVSYTKLVPKNSSSYIVTTSGMMQGILHFTSSLLHLCFLKSCKGLTLQHLRIKHKETDVKFSMTSVCSSDDSATILSVFLPRESVELTKEEMKPFHHCNVSLSALTYYCEYFGMSESEKSTTGAYDYVEFNSEFILKNTLAIPMIKFVAASINLTESESYAKRFFENYNLISSLYGSGFPSMNTIMCQFSQLLLHYKTMGSHTCIIFDEYVNKILEYPDMVHGFFMLDTDLCCGLLGLSFSRWMAIRNSDLLYQSKKLINVSEMEVGDDGTIVDSLNMKHGNHFRWYKLLDRVATCSLRPTELTAKALPGQAEKEMDYALLRERMELMNSIPSLLYRHPESKEELKIKLLSKCMKPGVSKSVTKGCPLIQAISSSVYSLFTHPYSRSSVSASIEEGVKKLNKKTQKYSILSSLIERISFAKQVVNGDEDKLNKEWRIDDYLKSAFPLHTRYVEACESISEYDNFVETKVSPLKHKKSFVIMNPTQVRLPLTLLQTVGRLWFGFRTKHGGSVFKRCLDHYSNVFPWICETIEETLSCSPFRTHVELHGFISSQDQRHRVQHMNCPLIASNLFSSQVSILIRKCFYKGVLIVPCVLGGKTKKGYDESFSRLGLALSIPRDFERKNYTCKVLNEIANERPTIEHWVDRPHREFSVGMISLYQKGLINRDDIMFAIHQRHVGTLITFTYPQAKQENDLGVRWVGKGECVAYTDGITIKLQLNDNFIDKIETNNWDKLRRNVNILRELLDQLNSGIKHVYVSPGNYVAKFDGSHFNSPKGSGCPIYVDQELMFFSPDIGEFNIEIFKDFCRLAYTSHGRSSSVFKYKSNLRDLSATMSGETGRDLWDTWMTKSKLNWKRAFVYLHQINDFINDNSKRQEDRENMKKWINDTMLKRLSQKGYASDGYEYTQSLLTAADDNDQDLDLNDWAAGHVDSEDEEEEEIFEVFGSNNIEREVKDILIRKSMEDKELSIENIDDIEDAEFGELFSSNEKESLMRPVINNWHTADPSVIPTIARRDYMTYLYLHPFWDDFISECIKMDSQFFSKLLSGVVPVCDVELAEVLMKLLNIEKKHVQLSLTQVLKQENDIDEGHDPWWEPGNFEGGCSTSNSEGRKTE
uniref:RNA-directed RNA polymerase L n=1 Tax=Lampyris noctiluca bunyan-like virus 1 TaxID=2553071 RepID=A0A482JTV2_9VIRU|nr:putative polyprotein [Lampyris noctiluca bunyan-like virus 1]